MVDVLGIELVIIRSAGKIGLQRKASFTPGKHFDDGHLDQRLQTGISILLIHQLQVEQGHDKRLTLRPGIFLHLQSLLYPLFTNGSIGNQYLADPHTVIEVIGTDDVAILKHQLTLSSAPLDT